MNSIDTDQYIATSQIHPINAQYLLKEQSHRLYVDPEGGILELMVRRFANTSLDLLDQYGGVIAVSHYDPMRIGTKNIQVAHILSQNGRISTYRMHLPWSYIESPRGLIVPDDGIDMDLIYMLLNPIDLNNWYLQDPKHIDLWGKYLPWLELSRIIAKVRNHFLEELSLNKK